MSIFRGLIPSAHFPTRTLNQLREKTRQTENKVPSLLQSPRWRGQRVLELQTVGFRPMSSVGIELHRVRSPAHPNQCRLVPMSFRTGHVLFVSYTQRLKKKEEAQSRYAQFCPSLPLHIGHCTSKGASLRSVTPVGLSAQGRKQECVWGAWRGEPPPQTSFKNILNNVKVHRADIIYPRSPASVWQSKIETRSSDFWFLHLACTARRPSTNRGRETRQVRGQATRAGERDYSETEQLLLTAGF